MRVQNKPEAIIANEKKIAKTTMAPKGVKSPKKNELNNNGGPCSRCGITGHSGRVESRIAEGLSRQSEEFPVLPARHYARH
jgi:hypothetical protein